MLHSGPRNLDPDIVRTEWVDLRKLSSPQRQVKWAIIQDKKANLPDSLYNEDGRPHIEVIDVHGHYVAMDGTHTWFGAMGAGMQRAPAQVYTPMQAFRFGRMLTADWIRLSEAVGKKPDIVQEFTVPPNDIWK
jgi:hypothetical protein